MYGRWQQTSYNWNEKLLFSNSRLLSSDLLNGSSRGSNGKRDSVWVSSKSTIDTSISKSSIDTRVSSMSISGNSRGVDIADWAGDEDVMAVFSLLEGNKLSISRGGSIYCLESSGLVLDGLLGHGGDSVNSSQTISRMTITSVQELRSAISGNGKS